MTLAMSRNVVVHRAIVNEWRPERTGTTKRNTQVHELCTMACSGHDATHEQHSMHSPIPAGTVLPSFSS